MNIRTALVQALICLPLVAVSGTAMAENNYPGLQCVTLAGTVQPTSDGHVENTGATTATVACPVVVDAATSGQAASGTPSVFVTDQNFNSNVCCSSRLKNTGSSVISGGSSCSAGTNSAYQGLALTNPSIGYTFTHRWLQCDLPPIYSGQQSEVRFYRY